MRISPENINGDDYFRIDAGYNAHATGYSNGDFNYDGRIDADDYFLIDKNYSEQGTAFSQGAPLSLDGVAAVPEPGSVAFIVVVLSASLNSMPRRRRALEREASVFSWPTRGRARHQVPAGLFFF